MSESDPVTCRHVREGLTEYLEDALPADRRQGFARHLATCPRCRRWLDGMDLTLQALAALPREPMPDEAKRALLRAFRGRRSA